MFNLHHTHLININSLFILPCLPLCVSHLWGKCQMCCFRCTRSISVGLDRARRLQLRCVSAGQRTSLAASLQNRICRRYIAHTCLHMWAHGLSFYLAAPWGATCHMRFHASDVISSIRQLRRSERPAGAKFKVWDQWNLSGGGNSGWDSSNILRFQQCVLLWCVTDVQRNTLPSSPSSTTFSLVSFFFISHAEGRSTCTKAAILCQHTPLSMGSLPHGYMR